MCVYIYTYYMYGNFRFVAFRKVIKTKKLTSGKKRTYFNNDYLRVFKTILQYKRNRDYNSDFIYKLRNSRTKRIVSLYRPYGPPRRTRDKL